MELGPASISFEGTKMVIKVDSNRDGEPMLTLILDIPEGIDEAFSSWKKKA